MSGKKITLKKDSWNGFTLYLVYVGEECVGYVSRRVNVDPESGRVSSITWGAHSDRPGTGGYYLIQRPGHEIEQAAFPPAEGFPTRKRAVEVVLGWKEQNRRKRAALAAA
jgi:hypothetical protein